MKTIRVTRIFVIAMLFGFVSVFTASAESPAAISAKNIRQKFVQAVQNPEDMSTIPTTGEVEVVFTVKDDGTVDIKKLQADNDDAASYVKEKITNVFCQDIYHPVNQYYKVKFRFQQD